VETQKAFSILDANFVEAGVWDDAMMPTFGAGQGAAAPSDGTLATASPSDSTMDIHCLTFAANTDDRVYGSVQIPHDLLVRASGNLQLRPHVHWTFISEPSNAQTVIWKLSYVYASYLDSFAAAPTILTSGTYTTSASTEIRKHLISTFSPIVIPVASAGPSMLVMFTLKLDSSSTISANVAAVLSTDLHYEKGPLGTNTEYGA
jgi:hypothetical protein